MADTSNVTVIEKNHALTIVGIGELDLSNSQRLKEVLKKSVDRDGEIVLDLRNVEFIDSAVLAYIARAGGALLDRNRCLKLLVCDGSQPLHVLKLVKFEELVEIVVEPAAQRGARCCGSS